MAKLIAACYAALFCFSCASAIPSIYLSKSEITMELNKSAFGISALAVSRDGTLLLTGDNGGGLAGGSSKLRIWDITRGEQVMLIRDGMNIILSVAVTPDKRYALTGGIGSGGGAEPLKLWDLKSGGLVFSKQLPGMVNSVDFSPDGKYFVAAYGENITVFFTSTGEKVKDLRGDYPPFYHFQVCSPVPMPVLFARKILVARFTPDGKQVLSSGYDAVMRLWDLETGKEIRKFSGHKRGGDGGVNSIAITSNGKYAVTSAYNDKKIRVWDLATGTEARSFSGFKSLMLQYAWGVSLAPDDRRAFFVTVPPSYIWDIGTGKQERKIEFAPSRTMQIFSQNPVTAVFNPNGKSVIITPNDAAVRILDASTGRETAMMVGFDDGEWIAITTEGYYHASEKGARYLTVKAGGKSFSVEHFYDVFYRPDILAAKLRGDDISGLISTITMEDVIRKPPPSIEFTSRAVETGSMKIRVCYRIKNSGGGIGEVRLFHNGKLIESDGYYRDIAKSSSGRVQLLAMNSRAIHNDMRGITVQAKREAGHDTEKIKGTFDACREIDPLPGDNEISVTAFNHDNTIQGYMNTVKVKSGIAPRDPHLYILSIGIDTYRDGRVNLKYPVKDAAEIKGALVKQSGTLFRNENIHFVLLTNTGASKTSIMNAVDALSKRIGLNDSFIFFVAGHGVLLQNQYYMLTHDYNGELDVNVMISSNEIVDISKKIKSLNQLFVFDTCHAGGVDYIVSGLYDARMSVLARKMGLHIFASANSIEQAMDGYRGNGLFTYALLDGLNNRNEADVNLDRKVSLAELGEYAKKSTVSISGRLGFRQTPLIINFGRDSAVYQLK